MQCCGISRTYQCWKHELSQWGMTNETRPGKKSPHGLFTGSKENCHGSGKHVPFRATIKHVCYPHTNLSYFFSGESKLSCYAVWGCLWKQCETAHGSLSEAAHRSPVAFSGLSSILPKKSHRTEVCKLWSNSFIHMVVPKRTTCN